MQFLAAIEQHVSSTRDDIGQECTPDTYPHRIIFMGMVVDEAPQERRGKSPERPEAPRLRSTLSGQGTGSLSVKAQIASGNMTSG